MRLDNNQVAISKTVESAYNTAEGTAANYEDLPTNEPFFILPKMEKTSNAVRVGRNAPTHLCNTYWSHAEVTVKDDIETGVPGRLFRRGLGGASTPTLAATGVYDHNFAILPPQIGDILPSFNIVSILGAADWRLHGLMVDKLKFSQKGAERAQYEAGIVGSGKFTNPSAITMPAAADPACMDGFRTVIKYTDTDGSTVINLSTLGTVVEWMIEHDNKIRRNKRRIGDPIQIETVSGAAAAHVKSQPRGKYETKGQLVVDFVDLADWRKSIKNQRLTNLSILVRGPLIANVAGTDYFHEFEIIVPVFSFDSPDTGDDEGDATTPINIVCLEDPVTKGTLKGRVRNPNATLV